MRVECINADRTTNITVGKVYEPVECPLPYQLSDTLYITNDRGEVAGYYRWRFKEKVDEQESS
jgi:hypothetical protein